MLLHDALHSNQADAGTFKVLRAMQALKDSEQFVDIIHVEADAVVPNHEHQLSSISLWLTSMTVTPAAASLPKPRP